MVIGMVYILPQVQPFLASTFSGSTLWNALWPLLLGLPSYLACRGYPKRATPIPAGDLVVLIEAANRRGQRFFTYFGSLVGSFCRTLKQSLNTRIATNHWRKAPLLPEVSAGATHPGVIFIGVLLAILMALAVQLIVLA